MKNIFSAALFLCIPAAIAAPGCSVPPVAGKTYHQARAALIEAGFKPVAIPTENTAPLEPWRALGYLEAFDCAGTGAAGCMFAWRTGQGRKVTITTAGEDAPPRYFALVRRAVCE